jgi:hypothetical protein
MLQKEIIRYIKAYQDSYSKEQIVTQLLHSGISQEEIDKAYSALSSPKKYSSHDLFLQETPIEYSQAIFISILGLFIPIFGIVMIISGLILAYAERKKEKEPSQKGMMVILLLYVLLGISLGIHFYGYSFMNSVNL